MSTVDLTSIDICRRTFLGRGMAGFGALALRSLFGPALTAAPAAADLPWRGVVNPLHHAAKARRVIFLYQAGGPSHLESFDYKPKLAAMNGEPMPESFTKGQQLAQLQRQKLMCFAPQFAFQRFGRSGQELSEIFPHLGSVADELCIIRSMYGEQINHDPAHQIMNNGSILTGRPSFGSWLLYGLGSEAENLPGFVVMVSTGRGGSMQPIAARQWAAGILPTRFQGVKISSFGDPVSYIDNPPGITSARQADAVETIKVLDQLQHQKVADPEILTRIAQYEMAFKMQTSVPALVDFGNEPQRVLDAYGARPGDGSYASNCLLARRLAERGVRFIQLYHRDWDHHSAVKTGMTYKAEEVDRPTAALINDLKQRGMLDDTLVIFGGEFGRTPMSQTGDGRDHHIKAFSYAVAGGGVKGGVTHGSTDDLGYAAVENPVSVHDFHATMLHLLGIDHHRLAVQFQGLDVRLTGVTGDVVRPILA
jgi:hypothetical protein